MIFAISGYTQVTERVLENQVAQGVVVDVGGIPFDLSLWIKNRLPAKLEILRKLQAAYPDVFEDEEELVEGMSRDKFVEILLQSKTSEQGLFESSFRKSCHLLVSKFNDKNSAKNAAELIFDHYLRFHVLHLFPAEAPNKLQGTTFWRRSGMLHSSESLLPPRNASRLNHQLLSGGQHPAGGKSYRKSSRAVGGLLSLLPHTRSNYYSTSQEDVINSCLDSLDSVPPERPGLH